MQYFTLRLLEIDSGYLDSARVCIQVAMLARWPSRHAILSSIRTIPVRKRHSTMLQPEGQAFERLLVLDFEATCDNQPGTIKPQV